MPRRAMRTWPISGMNCGQSPCWPGVRISVTGRHRRSATRWILVVSPPRERPRASRPGPPASGFLSFGGAPPGPVPRSGRGGRRPRADARARRWNRRSPSSPRLRPHRTRPAERPGPAPRSRPATSGDAAHRQCSSSQTPPAGPATGTPSGSGTRSPRSPPGGHSSDAPAADAPATAAPACPTAHPSRHDDSADHSPRTIYTSPGSRSTRHALEITATICMAGVVWIRHLLSYPCKKEGSA